jgi:ribonuclease BN (tRNA processing enzyme)
MKLRVLGCSGSPYPGHLSSSFLVNDELLIDAGSAASQLTTCQRRKLLYVLISHMHIDHTKELGFLPFSKNMATDKPLIVAAPTEILSSIKRFIFNPEIWYDLSDPCKYDRPPLKYMPFDKNGTLTLSNYEFTSVRMFHTIPTYGYIIMQSDISLAYSSDTGPETQFWNLCRLHSVKNIIVECSLSNVQVEKAMTEGHMTPLLLKKVADEFQLHDSRFFIFHLKPATRDIILKELSDLNMPNLTILEDNLEVDIT